MKSIFDIELRISIEEEFEKIMGVFFRENTIIYERNWFSFIELLNDYYFCEWKYGETCLSVEEYLNYIGVYDDRFYNGVNLSEESFLMLLEFICNMTLIIHDDVKEDIIRFKSAQLKKVLYTNVPLILEKMNYQIVINQGLAKIIKRDSDVDSVLDIVPEDISELLLSYNDIRIKEDIKEKGSILKKLDLYIEKRKNKYKQYNNRTYDSVQFLVNKLEINHPKSNIEIDEKEQLNYYDKCFVLMLHLIRTEKINNYNNEVDNLKKQIDEKKE